MMYGSPINRLRTQILHSYYYGRVAVATFNGNITLCQCVCSVVVKITQFVLASLIHLANKLQSSVYVHVCWLLVYISNQ